MTVTLAMPQLGLTMTEATVGTWLKKPGDAIRKDEPLLSISTDKVDMDIESNVDGVLRDILVEEGKTVPVGTPLALVDAIGKASSTPAPVPPAETFRSSPRARREARRLGIDIATVKGSGPEGRIVEKDLLQLAPAAMSSPADAKRRQ